MKRSGLGKLLKAVAVAAGLGLVFAVIWYISAYQTQSTLEAKHQADKRAEQTKGDIDRACVGISDQAALRECISREIEASRADQRAEYDLSAQERMAEWALWMMGVSALTMALTGGALWYVKLTLHATREANNLLRRAAENDLRPWLQLKFSNARIHVHPERRVQFFADVEITNRGKFPATEITLGIFVFSHTHGTVSIDDIMASRNGWLTQFFDIAFPDQVSTGTTFSNLLELETSTDVTVISQVKYFDKDRVLEVSQIWNTFTSDNGLFIDPRDLQLDKPGRAVPIGLKCHRTVTMT
jgi:hypothetical protein